MKAELKRIFISDLPDGVSQKDIEQKFGPFGQVTSIEIKHRKDIGPKNKTQQFAFININIDDRQLKNCFDSFVNKKWKGSYVEIQLAKESFLDRLKREREQAQGNCTAEIVSENVPEPIKTDLLNGKKKVVKKYESSSSSSEDSSEEEEKVPEKPTVKRIVNVEIIKPEDVYEDMVVKNNKFKKFNGKIEGFGKEPVVVIEPKKKKSLDPFREAANKKRINSMLEMKRSYNKQKSVIKSALTKIDTDVNNATKLVEDVNKGIKRKANKTSDKKALFDEEDGNDEEINLEVKEQFQGRKGQQLFELQSKYKNDKRFKMDSRFAEEEEEAVEGMEEDEEEISREEESRKQLEILGEVLGKKITPRQCNENAKGMLRFDPSQPDHKKYEIQEPVEKKKKKKKDVEEIKEVLPEVSSEKFYQVTDTLKQSLEEKQSFSLLSMFGKNNTQQDEINEEEYNKEVVGKSEKVKGGKEKNPFRYDSTDDEDEDRRPKKIELIEAKNEESKEASQKVRMGPAKLWTEPFFFRKDDYRFQEGVAFMKKLQNSKADLLAERRDVREIIKYRMNRNMKQEVKNKYNKKAGLRKMSNRMKRK